MQWYEVADLVPIPIPIDHDLLYVCNLYIHDTDGAVHNGHLAILSN
jgi:hypothetical protein